MLVNMLWLCDSWWPSNPHKIMIRPLKLPHAQRLVNRMLQLHLSTSRFSSSCSNSLFAVPCSAQTIWQFLAEEKLANFATYWWFAKFCHPTFISWHIQRKQTSRNLPKFYPPKVSDEKFTTVFLRQKFALCGTYFILKLSQLKQHNFLFTWQLYSGIHKMKRCSVTSTLSGGYTMNSDANITVGIMWSDQYILIMGGYFQVKMIFVNILSKTKQCGVHYIRVICVSCTAYIYIYCILPVNSHDLSSGHPQVIASGCSANTVINTTLR